MNLTDSREPKVHGTFAFPKLKRVSRTPFSIKSKMLVIPKEKGGGLFCNPRTYTFDTKMHLDRVEISGFKSFRERTVIEFPDSFTSIIGPNGSGKSNVVDAICFVLGKSRGLRASNLTELIYNDGKSGKPAERAYVNMHISNGPENIKITREIRRNGASIYRMNGRRTTRQEILDIVGDNEYNIILQDDITKVIDMRPVDRRGIIDEICGIAEYDEKRDRAVLELKRVEDRISETHIVIGEKQAHLRVLEKERADAIRYKQAADELNRTKATILARGIERLQKRVERFEKDIGEFNAEKTALAQRAQKIKQEISEKNNHLKEINEEILKLEAARGGSKITEISGEIKMRGGRISDIQHNIDGICAETAVKLEKQKTLEAELSAALAELDSVNKKHSDAESKISALAESIDASLEGKIDEAKERLLHAKTRIGALSREAEKNGAESGSLSAELESIEKEMSALLAEEEKLARLIDEADAKGKSGRDKMGTLKKSIANIAGEIDNVRASLEKLSSEHAKKHAELAAAKHAAMSDSIGAVMQLKETTAGIHGTVSQLGEVSNPDYETALQVAAGGRLNHIVVEDDEVAARCIAHLKKRQVGRATFIPLNKINSRVSDEVPDGAIGLARDFIKTSPKFRQVFELVLGDTLIVDDIEAARAIGIGRHRMVTLDGDLTEKSGVMTGGWMKQALLSFSNLGGMEEEVKRIEAQMTKAEGRRGALLSERKALEAEIERLEDSSAPDERKNEELRIRKAVIAEKRQSLKKRADYCAERIREIEKIASDFDSEGNNLKKDIAVLEKKLDGLLKKRDSSDVKQLDEAKDALRDINIGKNHVQSMIESLKKAGLETSSEIKKVLSQKEKFAQDVKKLQEERRELEKELKAAEKASSQTIGSIKALIEGRAKIEEEITGLGEVRGGIDHKLGEISGKTEGILIGKAKSETELSGLERDAVKYKGVEPITDKNAGELEAAAAELEGALEGLGSVNMRAIETYDTVKKELDEINGRLGTLKDERQSIFNFMEQVETRKREVFMETFNVVKQSFERIFAEISEGSGTLILDNPKDISASGLVINASPKGKKLMNLDAMSGGEKVLTSSAFLLAVQRYKPSAFYIVDELDAALDKKNSIKLAQLLKKSVAQFILITHNDSVMKFSDSVIGVSMSDGVSQVVGVKLT